MQAELEQRTENNEVDTTCFTAEFKGQILLSQRAETSDISRTRKRTYQRKGDRDYEGIGSEDISIWHWEASPYDEVVMTGNIKCR